MYGWGGEGGRVYQKAYIEFFASPDLMKAIVQVLHRHPTLNFNAINSEKVEISSGHKSVTGAHLLVCSCHSIYTVVLLLLRVAMSRSYYSTPLSTRLLQLSTNHNLSCSCLPFYLQRSRGVCSPIERSCSPPCSTTTASSSGQRR